ncbi:hypothetical protein [Congregibacter sp.]|uniref:hypothetical protein n=1 Tax=Congregibacter sp. TaxID=2744308 RepID=UPI0039E68467
MPSQKIYTTAIEVHGTGIANALALQQLGYGSVLESLDVSSIRRWLVCAPSVPPIDYPDVASAIVSWLSAGDLGSQSQQALSDRLRAEVMLS